MENRSTTNWRLRIGFVLSAMIGIAWGLLLGWTEIRVNAWLSPWYVLFVGMPIAFFGSMIVGMVAHRMLLSWHKFARLLVSLLMVAVGFPIGLLYGVFAHGYEPFQLIQESGPTVWYLEWAIAILGLFGGMWPRWTVPFLKLFGRFGAWLSQGPLAILRWIGDRTLGTFETIGHAIFWLPTQAYRKVTSLFQRPTTTRERETPASTPAPTTAPEPPSAPRPPRTTTLRRRAKMLKPRKAPVVARNNGHNGDSLRLTGVVEDRCPYCLDVVKKKDPRGVKKCEVCGTPHHADCWAITGKCQVPHLNT
ncbi:MAG: hypothetical protein HZB51_32935 [Chloroflexi bacterium]|nr:hypothetical protein [Chloroflexota bacterium]